MSVFVDEVLVEVKAGRGGHGKVAYRREAYVEFGGPSGGNGGRGGHIYFIGDEGDNTLLKLRYNRHIKAEDGENGRPKNQNGRNGQDTYVRVPLGTICYKEDGTLIGEILYHNQTLLVAKGGKGGRGNRAFQSNKNKAPDFAEQGDLGESFKVKVELQVLADVGLLGFPSVGKSTFINAVSNTKVKTADYPFTTLSPYLGMVRFDEGEFVVADLPGLIENAHLGVGLGIQFLRHIERCRVLLHIVSMDSEDPFNDYQTINRELMMYDEELLKKPQIVVANKMDIENADEKLKAFKKQLGDIKVYPISAIQKEGLEPLKYAIADLLKGIPRKEPKHQAKLYQFKEEKESTFIITKADDGVLELSGDKLFQLFNRTDFNNDSAIKRFSRQLRGLGIDDALKEAGVKPGDTVRIFSYEFEYIE